MAVKLSEKMEKRIKEMSEYLGMSIVDTERSMIEIGLSQMEAKRNAQKSNEMQYPVSDNKKLFTKRATNGWQVG